MRLRLENLSKKFGNLLAVNNISLNIEEGEIVSLLGPSGCGKTTTLNMIAGFERSTSGEIYFDTQCMNDVHPKERNVGMVFQEYAIFSTMTVYQNIAFGMRMRKIPRKTIKSEVKKIAENLNLTDILYRHVGRLNLSELQRVALGRTLSTRPSIMLLDEPLSNLDATLRERTRVELKRFHDRWSTTMVYVTHDQLEATALADRIAIMKLGELQQFDNAEVIYRNPANIFVATFIGNPPSNIVKGDIKMIDGVMKFQNGSFQTDISSHVSQIKKCLTGDKAAIGFHPEDITMSRSKIAGQTIDAEVYAIEFLGYEKILDLKVNDILVRALVPSDFEVNIGSPIAFSIPSDKVTVFDLKTEENISRISG